MAWKSVIGQDRVKSLLQRSFSTGRVAHAYLFYGPEGVGKDPLAVEFAKLLNCERGGGEACDECNSCRRVSSLRHPNIKFVFALPVGKSEKFGDAPLLRLSEEEVRLVQEQVRLKAENPYHNISVPRATFIKINSIRDLKRETTLTAFQSGKKVFIISDADSMNDEASNSLLKSLEEPTASSVFILTTANREKLLPTIVSRCQAIHFDLLRDEEIRAALVERERRSDSEASVIARLAHGSYSRSLELLSTEVRERRVEAVNFIRAALNLPPYELAEEVERIASEYDRAGVEQFLSLILIWIRDALVLQQRGAEGILNIDDSDTLVKFSNYVRNADFGELMRRVERSLSLLGKNVYIRLVLMNLGLEMRRIVASK